MIEWLKLYQPSIIYHLAVKYLAQAWTKNNDKVKVVHGVFWTVDFNFMSKLKVLVQAGC